MSKGQSDETVDLTNPAVVSLFHLVDLIEAAMDAAKSLDEDRVRGSLGLALMEAEVSLGGTLLNLANRALSGRTEETS